VRTLKAGFTACRRRPSHLFEGLVKCGCCSDGYARISKKTRSAAAPPAIGAPATAASTSGANREADPRHRPGIEDGMYQPSMWLGGLFEKAPNWQSFVVRDRRLITGQNPASSTAGAQALLKLLSGGTVRVVVQRSRSARMTEAPLEERGFCVTGCGDAQPRLLSLRVGALAGGRLRSRE
jgi:hypothetical protein